jgi:hypothetical protein
MIAIKKRSQRVSPPAWHNRFLEMLPTIVRNTHVAFREKTPEAREELIQEAVANCLVAYVRLVERGKEDLAYSTVLAKFAIKQIKDGRRVGKKINIRDVYDQHTQIKGGFQLRHLGTPRDHCGGWKEQLVENARTPVADQVAFRLDFPAWLSGLSARNRKIVNELALGERPGDVARQFRVSAARISQLRGELRESWEEFTDDETTVAAV